MKFNPIPLVTAVFVLCISGTAQENRKAELLLRNGSVIPERNITQEKIGDLESGASKTAGKYFIVIQFERIPSEVEKQKLKQAGIELLEYIPNNAYSATVTGQLSANALLQARARAVITLTPLQKMQPALSQGIYPSHALRSGGSIDVWISFPASFSAETVITELTQKDVDIVGTNLSAYRIIALRLPIRRLEEIARLSVVEYMQPAPPADKVLNYNSRIGSRANILSMPGGRNLRGEGIVIGVGDNTDPQTHIDFTNRLITRAPLPYNNMGSNHGTHVAGTAGGGGIGDEQFTGYAPKARLITQASGGIIANAAAYVKDDSMVITNNSYGLDEDGCAPNGIYDLYSRIVDQQAFDLPRLQHVFAAGNSGGLTCAPYPFRFHTVLGSYQSSKNGIDVGSTTNAGVIANSSSRGPVNDGRLKPEITAQGFGVASSIGTTPNGYGVAFGTSMASPAVAGGSALLYERYKQLNGGVNPKSGLIKALVCNGARDLGNPGPDYVYGFGWLNLLRSVEMMENNRYVISSVANAGNNSHTISVPANTAQLKVMLYWHDPPASLLSTQALVNDLDLEVRDASNVLTLPWLLDTIPANVNNPATRSADHINNIEQVVITNPASGDFTVNVLGTAITQNPSQEYFLVYDIVPVQTIVTHPAGGEKFFPGEQIYFHWDSYGDPANTFTVSYSTNNGSTWVDTTIAADARIVLRTLPNIATDQALFRVTRNGTGMVSTSQPFTIVGIPVVTLAPVQCEGYISLQWGAISGATDYEVMLLQGDEMVSRGTTTATSFTLSGLSKDSVYWYSVRARINGNPGRRSNAMSRQPNSGTCAGAISNNDLKVDSILSPVSGRVLTSSELTATTVIRARFKNLDDNAIASFNVKYSVNGGAFVSEPATNIGAGATYTHNFAATYDFSAIGTYQLRVVIENTSAGDPVTVNDTMSVIIKQLPNAPITIVDATGFLDNLEGAADSTYYRTQIGLEGAERYDFTSSTVFGRVRTFVNTGIAYSGDRALTLDADRLNNGTADSLKATFNLLPHFNTPDDIRLDFMYKHHGQLDDPANRVWIRGSDTQPWLEVYDLFANQADTGVFRRSASIEVSDILAANGQDFSTSFQVRFGQHGYLLTADNNSGAGYTFDDIHLYKVDNDIQMVSIDTPVVASCALTNSVPIRVTVRNTADTAISNIPVSYVIDNGTIVTEMISTIPGNTNISYTFTGTGDLAALGPHTIQAWVDYPGDSFAGNDTVTVTILNSPMITSFPHLENFENGSGGWYSAGKNDSWEFGTPASPKINGAASGSNAWKTGLAGTYSDQQLSYLYSPCYDLTGMTNPRLSFSLALDLEDCGAGPNDLCDAAYMEYSADGVNWQRLGAAGQGTNWYNRSYAGNNHVWSVEDYTNWHVATIALPAGLDRLRLRFVISSDPFVNREGIAIDDIHIYDSVYGIYDGPPFVSPGVNQPAVNGTGWIDFVQGGKLLASVNPNGQNMGSTDTRTYINTSAVRINSSQYYHDRNITIKPANRNLADSVLVRFYFLDTETETLLNATGCPGCSKPTSAYDLGVSKYTDADTTRENGTIADNASANWLFIPPGRVTIVPFDKGYYAEFKVRDFSEFWLNDGGIGNDQSLPAELTSFIARRQGPSDVLVEWTTASELNTMGYEIEMAKGEEEYRQNQFRKIGEVPAVGNSTTTQNYRFTDLENNKTGARYYRLRIIDMDGRAAYSAVRPVVFNNDMRWQVYPNPSDGIFNFVFQVNTGERVSIRVYDANGKNVLLSGTSGTGFVQKWTLDMQQKQFAAGLYLLEAGVGERKQVFRLIKK